MKKLNVFYVGEDNEYWKRLRRALSEFDQFQFSFDLVLVNEEFTADSSFVRLYEDNADIIYVDMTKDAQRTLSLCKLLCRNNVTRKKSTVALHSEQGAPEEMMKSVLAGVRLNYRKGVDFEDVAFHPLSLLNADIRPHYEYASGNDIRPFNYHQILRIGYISDDHFRVETNSPLEPDEVIELESHPLESIMPGKRFFPENYSDSGLYYNQRFSYKLKYTYVESPFFRASESSWLAFKQERKDSIVGNVEKKKYAYIEEDIDKRRREIRPIKEKVREWVNENQSDQTPKRLKVLVIDETLGLFKASKGNIDEFKYSINFQTHLTEEFYQIRRYRPHLIIFHYEDGGENGRDALSRVVSEARKIHNYEPYILVFNCQENSESLQSDNDYEHLLCYRGEVDLEIVRKLSGLLDERFHITEPEGKSFLKTRDPRSVAFMERSGKLLKFSESELYFESRYQIPMWTCFALKEPFESMITVVPMGKHSPQFKDHKNVYRALINGLGDAEKKLIRRLVNASLGDSRPKS